MRKYFQNKKKLALLLSVIPLILLPATLLAQGPAGGGAEYRTVFGWDSRTIVWMVAQLHLMFAAFVLGVPIFAVIAELIGHRNKDLRFDNLAREFTKLLTAAFSTTASLGGLLAFLLFGMYPGFMGRMGDVFHSTMYLYGLLFFGEAFSLYYYYYSWDKLKHRKGLHISIGILLNVFGTLLMFIANAWVTFMMSPRGVDETTLQFTGTVWQAINNPLWMPINVHRLIANVAFGGFIVGAYAAVKHLGSVNDEERAHYDWMGYVGNFIGVGALIPLPFAGYYLGREIYSASPVMGNIMMGGAFSWTFIIQAMLIGVLFIGANYYLWTGMQRISGAERYQGYIKYLTVILIVCFAIWLTPHNLPLSPREQALVGGQYHPVIKYLGLMSAKNAVVNFIILTTFFSFLLYRRGNKGKTVPFSQQGPEARLIVGVVGGICILLLGWLVYSLFALDPASMNLGPDRRQYFLFPAYLLMGQMAAVVGVVLLTFYDRGKQAQWLYFGSTVLFAVLILGVYGFVVMEKANPFLRQIAVVQVMMVVTCLLLNTAIDIFLFRGAEVVGGISWGRMPARSQYVLILLCLTIVILMGLMGFIRSGLREDWHIYGVMRDTSLGAYTPTMAYMAKMVAIITGTFLGLVTFVFWLSGLAGKEEKVAHAGEVGQSLPALDPGGEASGDKELRGEE